MNRVPHRENLLFSFRENKELILEKRRERNTPLSASMALMMSSR